MGNNCMCGDRENQLIRNQFFDENSGYNWENGKFKFVCAAIDLRSQKTTQSLQNLFNSKPVKNQSKISLKFVF